MIFKKILRKIYRQFPLKRPIILALRWLGVGSLISTKLKSYLVFEGTFNVRVEGQSFQMLNGYGREIEAAIFWGGLEKFEGATILWWKLLAKKSKVNVDVGANTGIYSLLAMTVNPNANILAFEPIERVYDKLASNIALNQNPAKSLIRAYCIALSEYSGKGLMYDLPVEHMYTASLNKDIHAERGNQMQACTESVLVSRLDDFLSEHNFGGLDLIKIDVESHEPEVLRGAGEWLARYHPSLIVEIWDNEVGFAVEEVLRACDYLYFAINDASTELRPHITNDFPEAGYINYLIVTKRIALEIGLLN
jgi:FkbM family methyltransferase